jgi:para-nitrobenzyl esterase
MKKTFLFSLLLLAVLILSTVFPVACSQEQAAWSAGQPVQTLYGPVTGARAADDVLVWKGIPYAKPPVGELRWEAPQDPEPWTEVLTATRFCSQCPQYDVFGAVSGSEDCLYLNIWRPQTEEGDLPVYFWIHGGGNSTGSASMEMYDGANIARQSDMVVVTVNYRLGPLGWFTYPALRSGQAGAELDDSGNYGTLDLIKALEWVQDNIEFFGGDPSQVTIAGESAGGMNVLSLLISPLAGGLFHRAICQSGIPVSASMTDGEESARNTILNLLVSDGTAANRAAAESYLAATSDEAIASYLRSKSAAQLLAAYPSMGLGMLSLPFIFQDGTVIVEDGFEALKTGEYPNKVPVMIGGNKEETKIFLYFLGSSSLGGNELYQEIASYSSDLWKAVGVDGVARDLRSNADQPEIYAYQFLWGSVGPDGQSVIPEPWGKNLGAFHGLDVPFFFGNYVFYDPLSDYIFTAENAPGREALSEAMMEYVAQFARTGDPNPADGSLTEWKPWSNAAGEPKCILLDASLSATRISMSDIELTQQEVIATADPEVLALLKSAGFEDFFQFLG